MFNVQAVFVAARALRMGDIEEHGWFRTPRRQRFYLLLATSVADAITDAVCGRGAVSCRN